MELSRRQKIRLTILECLKDGKERHLQEIYELAINKIGFNEEEKREKNSRGYSKVESDIRHYTFGLANESKIVKVNNGTYKITELGESDKKVDEAIAENKQKLEDILKEKLNKMSYTDFERLVAKLLEKMSYGVAIQRNGKSGDGGIDVIIKQDKLGLDKIGIQVKRYKENNISREVVESFAYAVKEHRRGITKGAFVTLSDFSDKTKKLFEDSKIILINGEELIEYMKQNEVGVKNKTIITQELDTEFELFQTDMDEE